MAWTDQPVKLLSGPPSRDGRAPRSRNANIAGSRPAFADSWAQFSPPSLVTEAGQPVSWRPADDEPGHWVRVDLEGPRPLDRVVVRADWTDAEYEVFVSLDARSFDQVGSFSGQGGEPFTIEVDRMTRYIELRFPGRPCGIHLIEAYETDGGH